jgi:hypothetical protein
MFTSPHTRHDTNVGDGAEQCGHSVPEQLAFIYNGDSRWR